MEQQRRACTLLVITFCIAWQLAAASRHDNAYVCFAAYKWQMNAATVRYENGYKLCSQRWQLLREDRALEQSTERDKIDLIAASVCKSLKRCNALRNDIRFLQCHAAIGPSNVYSMLSIRITASKALVQLEQEYEELERQYLLCINDAEQKFADDSAAALQWLSKCLKME